MRPHQTILERPRIELAKLALRLELRQLFLINFPPNLDVKLSHLGNI